MQYTDMAQRPAKRHVIAGIRIECGLSQPGLAKILGVAAVTVQRLEQGTLELSEDLARRAEEELGVSAAYLLANDPQEEPVTPRGGRWTTDIYELAQGSKETAIEEMPSGDRHLRIGSGRPVVVPETADSLVAWRVADYTAKIDALLQATKGSRRQGILLHRLNKALSALTKDFLLDQKTLSRHAPRIKKLKAAHDEIAQRLMQEEHDRIWPKEQES
jgi:transcriptional regulator with XRE-family HTH domain